MTRLDIAMAVSDAIAAASLAVSSAARRRTKRRLDVAKRCPNCGGRAAGYIHEPDCT